ncbi:bacteriocin-like protein [Chryseobacterium sp. BIGb0232]|uniref:bacteriocin-like protein n=1 Tax=Chryseobacterium sp. BIGb0232 TaxID=2940598 RepID=UPI000F497FEB|nr:hypothetical protein [Chryseobacterium sp. BIGb0232]MCS4305560.1 hypothetical protein [Chryseobacterium sp. BIGb0232]ROS06588.1 hypothetical protein EDF65_5133 [Chryseobacterium nakagawai]
MKNLKRLSRENLKDLKGGGESPNVLTADEGCSYKCCSDRNPQICSATVTVSVEQSGTVSCAAGSHLVNA